MGLLILIAYVAFGNILCNIFIEGRSPKIYTEECDVMTGSAVMTCVDA